MQARGLVRDCIHKHDHIDDENHARFVLYQLSKNLNRPFFMDFITHLSVRYAHGHVCDEEDPDEDGPLLEQMNHFLKPSTKVPFVFLKEYIFFCLDRVHRADKMTMRKVSL